MALLISGAQPLIFEMEQVPGGGTEYLVVSFRADAAMG